MRKVSRGLLFLLNDLRIKRVACNAAQTPKGKRAEREDAKSVIFASKANGCINEGVAERMCVNVEGW